MTQFGLLEIKLGCWGMGVDLLASKRWLNRSTPCELFNKCRTMGRFTLFFSVLLFTIMVCYYRDWYRLLIGGGYEPSRYRSQ